MAIALSRSLRLHSVVFITGASVLALEIVAGRAMQPAFGTSLYIWGAVLSVTLLCLAVGYRWGGAMADRALSPEKRLAVFIAAAAAWLLILPVITPVLLRLGIAAGGRMGPIVVALALFAIPLTLLATAVPLAFGALGSASQGAPATAMGRLFAVSTAGSIGGALIAAYVLVPWLGLKSSLFAVAIGLAIVAAAYAAFNMGARAATVLLIAGAIAHVLPVSAGPSFADSVRVVDRRDSSYGHIVVVDEARSNARLLLLDGTAQSIAAGPELLSMLGYAKVILDVAERHRRGRALLLGLGAGTVARALFALGYRVDAVELDPEMVAVAREHFRLGPHEAAVNLGDARRFIEDAAERGETYDLIVLDVAGAGHHPTHLYSLEAFEVMNRLLGPSGLLIVNMVSRINPVDPFGQAVVASLERQYEHVAAYWDGPSAGANQIVNLIAVAGDEPVPIVPAHPSVLLAPDAESEPATDDHTPGERERSDTSWHIRRVEREWLGDALIMPW